MCLVLLWHKECLINLIVLSLPIYRVSRISAGPRCSFSSLLNHMASFVVWHAATYPTAVEESAVVWRLCGLQNTNLNPNLVILLVKRLYRPLLSVAGRSLPYLRGTWGSVSPQSSESFEGFAGSGWQALPRSWLPKDGSLRPCDGQQVLPLDSHFPYGTSVWYKAMNPPFSRRICNTRNSSALLSATSSSLRKSRSRCWIDSLPIDANKSSLMYMV